MVIVIRLNLSPRPLLEQNHAAYFTYNSFISRLVMLIQPHTQLLGENPKAD